MKILSALFILISIVSFGQSADKIIDKHFEKTGSENDWKKLSSVVLSGQVVLGVEEVFDLKIYHKRPYYKKVVFIMDGKEVLNEGYDGKNGWTFDQDKGKNVKVLGYQPDAFDNDLLHYKSKGFTVRKLEDKTINGKSCYQIELTKNVNKVIYAFDKSNYQMVYEKNKEEALYYSDFKSVGGLTFAHKIKGKPIEGGEYSITFNSIKTNVNIPNKIFKFNP